MISALDESDLKHNITPEELRDNMVVFFLAGHETTANSIAFACYFMAKHPEVQERARKEILSVYNKHIENGLTKVPAHEFIPTYEEQKGLEYLTAIIKETLRLYPPVAQLPARITSKDVKLGEYTLPKNTLVAVDIFSMHHNSKVWGPDCEEFHPERFIGSPEEPNHDETHEHVNENSRITTKDGITVNHHPYAWNPFGGSVRSCIGQNFSMIEQRMLLSSMLLRYDLSLPSGCAEMKLRPGGLVSPANLFIDFKRRF